MNTVDGYAMSSWQSGYGDMVMTPDFSTLRRIPWLPGTALVMADLSRVEGGPVPVAPRTVLRTQLDRLAQRGLEAFVGTELEFMVFDDTYREAWAAGYRGLSKSTDYNVDYAIHASTRMEPLLRGHPPGHDGAGMYCEGVKGECNLGQQEIAFRYDRALATFATTTPSTRTVPKEIADQHGKSLTFMAKFDEREGNSCHIHISLRGADGAAVFADESGPLGMSGMFRSFVAASLRRFASSHSSMRRISTPTRDLSTAVSPDRRRLGSRQSDLRTRVVGVATVCEWNADSRRRRQPVPGGRCPDRGWPVRNRSGLELPAPCAGNAYSADAQRLPATLAEAAQLFSESSVAREAFGAEVVDHYLNNARIELAAFNRLSPTGKGCAALSGSSVPARPVIGLTTHLQQARTGVWDVPASFLPGVYLDGVTRCGGIATLLPPQPVDGDIADRALDRIDGLP